MAFYLEKAFFVNCAPFNQLELDLKEKGINVLSAVNGRGKTTILSHITDAFYELAKRVFPTEFEGKENKYYRIAATIYNIKFLEPSFVYFRFNLNGTSVDYIDVINECTQKQYDTAITLENKIPFGNFQRILSEEKHIKHWDITDKNLIRDQVFQESILTYFPSYRYETPGYLNDPYAIKIDYTLTSKFVGNLKNPIEAVMRLPDLVNWFLDVLLDMKLHEESQVVRYGNQLMAVPKLVDERICVWDNLNKILSSALSSKQYDGIVRLGIGNRNNGAIRVAVMNDVNKQTTAICPSIFNLSAGELALVSIFGEILHQADNLRNNIQLDKITGIVLIDEVDKHLHIRLQKEILPKLFNLFPNVQFIVSSHSPFFNMGLADEAIDRTQIIDLDNDGIICEPTNNELYREVYEMMINENNRFATKYNELIAQIQSNTKPIVITEGKTDYCHIKNAIKVLGITDVDVDFYNIPNDWGDSKLKTMLDNLSVIKQKNIVIGIFDRDSKTYLDYVDAANQQYKTFGDSNVYAFAIPLVNSTLYGDSISIEHYYRKEDLLKEEDSTHRRLFLGKEFYASGNSVDGKYQTKISNIANKVNINGIIDDKVFNTSDRENKTNVALTKNAFINLIETNPDYARDFDFSNFNKIIDIIRIIIANPLH